MCRGRSTTAADHLHTEVFDEVHELHLQFDRRQAIVGNTTDVLRQTRIGNAADGKWGML